MALKFFKFLVLMSLLAGCYHSQQPARIDETLVIPPDKMVMVLVDLHLADGAANVKQRQDIEIKDIAGPYLDLVLKKHQITRESLDESIRFYAYHMEEYGKIYEKVVEELGKIQAIERSTRQAAPTKINP